MIISLFCCSLDIAMETSLSTTRSTLSVDYPFTLLLPYPTFASTPYTLGPIYKDNLPTNPPSLGCGQKPGGNPRSHSTNRAISRTAPEIRIKPESLVLHHCVTLTVTISDSNKRSSPQIIFP